MVGEHGEEAADLAVGVVPRELGDPQRVIGGLLYTCYRGTLAFELRGGGGGGDGGDGGRKGVESLCPPFRRFRRLRRKDGTLVENVANAVGNVNASVFRLYFIEATKGGI